MTGAGGTPAASTVREPDSDRGPQQAYLGVAVLLVILAAALWTGVVLLGRPVPMPHVPAWGVVALFLGFLAGELFPLRFNARGHRLSVSLSELPLVLGVLLLDPVLVASLYLGAALLAFVLHRSRPLPTIVNLGLVAVETGAAFFVVALFHSPLPLEGLLMAVQPRLGPVTVGVLAGATLSAFAVAGVRRFAGVREPWTRVIGRSMLIAALITGLTLAGFIVWMAVPAGPFVSLALLAAALLLYRTYVTFLRQHAEMADLYAFGARVAQADIDFESWQELTAQVRQQMHVAVAALYLSDQPEGAAALGAGPDGELGITPPPTDHPMLMRAREQGAVIAQIDAATDPAIDAVVGGRGRVDVMIATLRSADRTRGYLGVWDVRPRWRRFTEDDRALLQTLAGHLATALDNHRLLASLKQAAYHDPVTGLVNRSGLEAHSAELAERGRFPGVLLLELHVLSDVTGALGQDRGEQLLVTVSERLMEAAGGQDHWVGRVDADRFAVLLPTETEDEALAFAETMLAAAGDAVVVDSVEVEPNAVAGIAIPEQHEGSEQELKAQGHSLSAADAHLLQSALIQQAQLALTTARAKDERIAVYRPAIGEVYQRRFQLVSQFRHAVDSGRVTVHYQPKLTLVDRELIGVEALVRWMHPEYGFVSPAELIEAIEPTSAIDVLFAHVLDTSLAQIASWLSRGMRIAVAVNLSVRNLLAENFAETVAAGLAGHQVPSELLTLEVTESVVMNQPERSLPVLQELHAMGIQLSVDDFGTGYSSLAYLRRLPIDELKIDRSFVQGMVTDLGDLAIVRAIIDLGHSLGMKVIAEGVEEEAGRDALRSMRCDAMQGFLLSRPLPIDRFESWLTSRTVGSDEAAPGRASVLRLRM